MKALLMLEDGKTFIGLGIGVKEEKIGEVILNTAVVGYQEMMTDPANAGKILILTYPLIGNYGTAPKFNESSRAWLAGLVIKEKSNMYSNWQATQSFDDFVKDNNLLAISKVDTRTLAVHIRQKGQMYGIISTQCFEPKELKLKIERFRAQAPESILAQISVKKPTRAGRVKGKHKIAVLDLGITQSIITQLERLNCALTLLPYNTPTSEIIRLKPGGLVISGGPEEDTQLRIAQENIKPLIGKIPLLGIATGHQVLARSLGGRTTKLKVGHHGVNYPIHYPTSFKGEVTVQNHSYSVDEDSFSKIKEVKITAYNLNDRTVEAIESKKLKLLGVQYNPASPGFEEVHSVLTHFIKMVS
ncbi:MAG: glutamine-hydrolyzing carbamoyl-phosphate synthase small subunit [Candidatus Omnitrophica bacterium]|nr:glutamine-hydrolyzing carbamoyl-phosphate synthase small subunit [Candidatus Omnitrophota bacterium]